ncbi:uncharacterized protein [Eleutherodactylus coqui]|uniref:uncharacterized protein isoform X2 n=1 Tax=Eleutherodactylus coqui TaxID=57060 RepID=UPI003462F121
MFDMGKLVALMQDSPVIWNTADESFKDRIRKELAWEELGLMKYGDQWTKGTVTEKKHLLDEIKKKWHSARDQFRKEYTAVPRSGDGRKTKGQYLFCTQLLYLAPTMDMQAFSDSLQEEATPEVQDVEDTSLTVSVDFPTEDAMNILLGRL